MNEGESAGFGEVAEHKFISTREVNRIAGKKAEGK
jgi:uncharacterized protein YdbL (DUF1318 family)